MTCSLKNFLIEGSFSRPSDPHCRSFENPPLHLPMPSPPLPDGPSFSQCVLQCPEASKRRPGCALTTKPRLRNTRPPPRVFGITTGDGHLRPPPLPWVHKSSPSYRALNFAPGGGGALPLGGGSPEQKAVAELDLSIPALPPPH